MPFTSRQVVPVQLKSVAPGDGARQTLSISTGNPLSLYITVSLPQLFPANTAAHGARKPPNTLVTTPRMYCLCFLFVS